MADVSAPVATNGESSVSQSRLQRLFNAQKAHASTVRKSDAAQRRAKIRRLREGVLDRRDEIRAALQADFRKAHVETDLSEVKAVSDEALFALQHLDEWMAPTPVKTPHLLLGTSSEVRYQPKGVVLILSPWNYPFNLTLGPLIAAIAAGCCAVVKPSEYTPNASAVMRDLVKELFDEREAVVVEGGVETAQTLLDFPFDHFYFTGSPQVGRIVMKAAAEHLSSCTLELGGKSPTLVDDTAKVFDAAAQIAWGKFSNCGQTCIAPDYILVHEHQHDALVAELRTRIRSFYGATDAERRQTEDYARLVNDKHFQRIKGLFESAVDEGAHVAIGGQHDAETRYFAPTVLTDVPEDSRIMQEEIFGPVLPVLSYRTMDQALEIIQSRPNPLALYIFSQSDEVAEHVIHETSAGGTCINEVLLHYMNPHLPFGGAGHSGIGKGHGVYAFDEFTHSRSVLKRSLGSRLMRQIYPPYTAFTRKAVDWVMRLF